MVSVPVSDGRYKIVSVLSEKVGKDVKVLEVCGVKANEGTPVDLWKDNNGLHQRWQLIKVDEDQGQVFLDEEDEDQDQVFYTIGHPNSSMVMEAPGPHWGGPKGKGVGVAMRSYEHGGDQRHRQWRLEHVVDNVYKIMNRRSDFVLDVEDGDLDKGAIKQQESWNAPDDRQHWRLIPSTLEA